jgi:hypothetical protein
VVRKRDGGYLQISHAGSVVVSFVIPVQADLSARHVCATMRSVLTEQASKLPEEQTKEKDRILWLSQ